MQLVGLFFVFVYLQEANLAFLFGKKKSQKIEVPPTTPGTKTTGATVPQKKRSWFGKLLPKKKKQEGKAVKAQVERVSPSPLSAGSSAAPVVESEPSVEGVASSYNAAPEGGSAAEPQPIEETYR